MYDFNGQVALVTGASGNLGKAVVDAFYQADAKVVAVDRSIGKMGELFSGWLESKDVLLAEGVDVTDPQAIDRVVQDVLGHFGKIDVLVNAVGGYRAGTPVHQTLPETWDFLMNLNARSAFTVSRSVIPAMLDRGRGKIINIAASTALKGSANSAAYSASKSAVARLTESMSDEYKRQGINVNAVLPGTIDTPQNRGAMPDANFSLWVSPEAIARVILFLASEDASPIHGALIPVFGRK